MIRISAPAGLAAGIGAALGTALLVTACSSGGSSSSTGAAPSSSAAAAGNGGGTVIATATSSGSTFLTDGGRAVYLWVKDSGGKSVCTGACAGAWPPVTTTGSVSGSGAVKSSDLSTITRADGTKQVTYDGHPLYFYVGDSGKGTATGQGSTQFGAKWWLVTPAGGSLTASVSSFTTSATSPGPSPAGSHSSSAGGSWG